MTDENKYNLVAPAPDLFASSAQIEEQINEKVPEDNEEGMRLGTPVDFAEQFNNTLISAAGAPVDMISWAGRKAMTTVGVSEETAGKWFPKEAFGSSTTIKEALNPLDIGSDRKADTLLGHAGNASAEGVALLTGGAGIIQKTKNLKGVVGGLSRSADDALRTNLGGVVTAEMIAGAGAGIGRGVAEDNEFGATGAFLTEFSTGALALLSAAGAKTVVVDPLIAKLNNMTQKEALEKLSKEEIAEVVAEGQRVIAKEDGGKIHQETVIEETIGETQPLEVTVGGEKVPSEAPEAPATTATPKETPEATPAPKTPEVAPEADPSNADEFVALVDQLLTGDRRRGRGIQGTDKVARVFDQYRERLNTVISGLRSGASTMDEASALLDELVKVAPKKFELDNVDAGSLAIRNPDKDPASFQALMTEEKAEIVADIERLREVINFQKDVGEDFDNIEALRKRILGDVEEAPVVKSEEPKPTSKGTEESAPKPTASQARIKKLEEETNLLHALVSGEDISQIDGVAGMHPSLKPKGNKTDTKTYEQFLKKRKAELKKAARELQKAEINVIKDRILNPAIYKRSRIDKALDVNFHARTAFGLSAPYSMTAGVVSAGL